MSTLKGVLAIHVVLLSDGAIHVEKHGDSGIAKRRDEEVVPKTML